MSWINDELPADWPSKGNGQPEGDLTPDFTTSGSLESIVQPTVAIQPASREHTPQWKEAIKPREKSSNQPHLTGIFNLPNISAAAQHGGKMDDTSDFSTEAPSTSSTSEQGEEPRGPINRRLKVFGRPDTYTNERLGNLLSSMGGGGGTSGGTASTTSGGSRGRTGGTVNASAASGMRSVDGGTANESDLDLANNLQNEGRKVLQGLAPYRPDLSAVQESSLDELEQQLTSQGTNGGTNQFQGLEGLKRDASPGSPRTNAMDTTTSDSGARTLDSLHSSMSNWDTMGGTHAAGVPLGGPLGVPMGVHSGGSLGGSLGGPAGVRMGSSAPSLHKRSSRTLCGSGRSRKPEEDLSALAISEPLSPLQQSGLETTSEQPSTSEAEKDGEASRDRNMRTRINSRRTADSYASAFDMSRKESGNYASAFDMTPDPRPSAERVLFKSPLASRHNSPGEPFIFRPSRQTSHQEQTSRPASMANEPSIAAADVSFSVAYERLAKILRERASSEALEDVDSLDLNNCDLESMVGLDKFVPNLTTLFANGNSIRSLQGLPSSVVHLDLTMNCMSPVSTFPTSFISTLILTGNELEDLRPLENLRALCSLDVSDNKLQSLRGIRSLTALRSLNVSGNQLQELHLNLGMLVELDASHNQISAVSLETPLLESLDLEGNQVVALNEPMPNIRVLNMRSNNATVDFQGWLSLETLLFDGNKAVRNIDAVAGNLTTFSWEQPIKKDRAAKLDFTKLTSVRDLKLGGIERGWRFGLDASMVYAVQHLDLSHCAIREVPPNIAEMFPFLTSLNLAFNKLDDRCIECLEPCAKLERLSLFGNRLTIKGQELASRLPSIRVLDSRSQRKRPPPLEGGAYVSDLYGELMDSDDNAIVSVKNKHLQWLDGHWTKYASWIKKNTTRPGFQSPLYPVSWEDRQATEAERRNVLEATTVDGTSLVGNVTARDVLKAMYVHHWRQIHGR